MRKGSLILLFATTLAASVLHAEELPPDAATTGQEAALQQRLQDNQERRQALNARIEEDRATAAERAQLAQLREENQRLRLQLQQEQAKPEPLWLGEDQQWFAVGGGVGVLGFLLGVLTTRGRRRRQWLN